MSEVKENKMGTLPVKRLIVGMSLPMMVSMLVQALYNIVDSMFVSRISPDALTAVTLAFPLQMLIISVGSGTGVGVNAILSRALGERKQERADAAAANGLLLSFLSFLVFVLIDIRPSPIRLDEVGLGFRADRSSASSSRLCSNCRRRGLWISNR